MRNRKGCVLLSAVLVAFWLAGNGTAQEAPAPVPLPADASPPVVRLTLEEARQKALGSSKLLALASLNVESKDYATRAARADYFPKVIGSVIYFHFDSPLGSVLTTRGRPLLGVPARQVAVNVVNQDAPTATVFVAQPLTALLKVRQGVKIAQADERIAQAQLEAGTRALLVGVEQLYWGLLASQRIRAGAQEAVRGAELLAKTGSLDGRTALAEARQGLHAAETQAADVEEQLNNLLDLPLCTHLEVIEPPLPGLPLTCADEAIGLALAASPEVREAEQTVVKARAAVKAAKVDYLPSVNVLGGYAAQDAADYIQRDFTYVGVVGSYTFFEAGKRKNTVREREMMIAMAEQKLRSTEDDVRLKAKKAFREVEQGREGLRLAEEVVQALKEAEKAARNPKDILAAVKARGEAEVELVKADLAFRTAHSLLMSLIGRQ